MMGSSTQVEFGYCPWDLCLDEGSIKIRTLPDLEGKIATLSQIGDIIHEWIYPKSLYASPYTRRVFSLPKTHMLLHTNPESSDHLVFHIWCLSFFLGIRLTATEAGFVDTTPIQPGKLVDFVFPLGADLQKAVKIADTFWITNLRKSECAKRLVAAIHALFLSRNPRLLQFEQFIFLYTALDACFALASSLHVVPKRALIHARRIEWMCGLFGITPPSWATAQPVTRTVEVAVLRNATIHEALFVGQPLGFAVHGVGTNQNLTLEMQALTCRLLVALLGASSDYVRSPINTRMRYSLDLR